MSIEDHPAVIPPEKPSGLYARILTEAWERLPESVRRAHAVGGAVRGCFRVTHGKGCLAKRVARWSRLPPEGEALETVLRITAEGTGERWDRSFGGFAFATSQWMTAEGWLAEEFQGWELVFGLRVEGAALVYEQVRARLCLGPLRLRFPLALAPRIRARESAVGANRVHVEVSVRLPPFGLLIAYDGHLDVEGSAP